MGRVGIEDDVARLKIDLASLGIWTEKWPLMFNVNKCNSMNIRFKNRKNDYELNSVPLGRIKKEKDLVLSFARISRFGNSASKQHLSVARCWG